MIGEVHPLQHTGRPSARRLEIEERAFAARNGRYVTGARFFRIPAVLFASVSKEIFPGDAETVLTERRTDLDVSQMEGKFLFTAPENSLLEGNKQSYIADGAVCLPSYIPFSGRLKGVAQSIDHSGEGEVFVSISEDDEMEKELRSGREIYVMADAVSAAAFPDAMARAVTGMRKIIGWKPLIYCQGVATPSNLALLIYSGIDIVDSLATDIDSARGIAYIDGIPSLTDPSQNNLCHCAGCKGERDKLFRHNRLALLDELNRIRMDISLGRIRERVERVATFTPWNAAFLRHLDIDHYSYFESVAGNAPTMIQAITEASLRRPDIVRYVERVRSRYTPPSCMRVALLVPCSHRKPYFRSRSHRHFYDAILSSAIAPSVHILTITSPLGIVPEELETVFPAAHYDIPVTGIWSEDEKARSVSMLLEILKKGKYTTVISHLEDEREFINSALESSDVEFLDTSMGRTRDRESLRRLSRELSSITPDGAGWKERNTAFAESVCAYQFGDRGRELVSGADVRGRYPYLRIISGETQLGMLTEERGVISLTIEGAERLCPHIPGYLVETGNFELKGNLFAAGVESAGKEIRVGDEVIVMTGGSIAGVGVARMSGREMEELERGEAVRMRHYRRNSTVDGNRYVSAPSP